MPVEYLNRINIFIQIVVVMGMIVRSISLVRKSSRPMLAAYFTFGCISFVMSDMYWLAYSFINPGKRMPFAANEFGESASFLLFASVLIFAFQNIFDGAVREIVLTGIFTAANIALWIGWSGEWLQDIAGGIIFGFFLCASVCSLKQTEALSRREWAGLLTGSYCLVILQGLIFFLPEKMKKPVDVFCYVIMYVLILFFFYKMIRAILRDRNIDTGFTLSFAAFGWTVVSLYMSAEPIYELTGLFTTIIFLFMLDAFGKKVWES